jgi:hypothetical protein
VSRSALDVCLTGELRMLCTVQHALPARHDWRRAAYSLARGRRAKGSVRIYPYGNDIPAAVLSDNNWAALGRCPYLLESSLPGVFAVGDVRANSVKRVAAAVGEGSMAVRLVQQYLGQVG